VGLAGKFGLTQSGKSHVLSQAVADKQLLAFVAQRCTLVFKKVLRLQLAHEQILPHLAEFLAPLRVALKALRQVLGVQPSACQISGTRHGARRIFHSLSSKLRLVIFMLHSGVFEIK
jgi:hypothetical protein